MKLSAFKTRLSELDAVVFSLPDGNLVPAHVHVTEVGLINKHFIDCGGTTRHELVASFQLWYATDYDHRLTPAKLLKIIDQAATVLGENDPEIEIEYQQETIGKFGLYDNGTEFRLMNKQTACLAEDRCGIPAQKRSVSLADLTPAPVLSCTPGSGCCE